MSLVAYESSDESDHESEDETKECDTASKVTLNAKFPQDNPGTSSNFALVKEDSDGITSSSGLFSLLPAPKRRSAQSDVIPEEPVSRNPLKKETRKIMIPSLKEFEDIDGEEETSKSKRKPSKVGSGLMSLLPAPQNLTVKETARQLVPLSVSRKAAGIPEAILPKPTSSTNKNVSNSINPSSKNEECIESDEETTVTDYFSLSELKETEIPVTQLQVEQYPNPNLEDRPQNNDLSSYNNDHLDAVSYGSSSSEYSDTNYCNVQYDVPMNSGYENIADSGHGTSANVQVYSYETTPQDTGSTLKNEAMVRLAGKKRSGQESIEFVDVNGDDLVAGREEWLLKSLSETNSYQPAPKRSDQPSAMHRRKHQITYLAFQAKAREQELKNQWSMNRMTKKQTQSKYGF